MAGTGLISVIIPVFNVEPYLVKALESVTCQTYRDLEIIIIDDGSTDGSGLICDDFANRDERIKVIRQENRGLSNARNAGLDIMKGEAVAFLDPDDSYHPDYIKAMAEAMDRTGADIIVCRYKVHHEDGPKLHINKDAVWPSAESGLYGRIEALRALADGAINVSVWNKLYGSDLWKEIRFPDGHNYEDVDTSYRVFDICRSVFVTDRALYIHLRRRGSITHTATESNVRDLQIAKRHFAEYVSDNTPAVFSFEQLNRMRQSELFVLAKEYIRNGGKGSGLSRAFADDLRAQAIEMGTEAGLEYMDLRGKAAYLMMRRCPAMLKVAFPVYHAARMLIYKITGR